MASKGQTIDAIKVGLGINFGQLSKDIKAAQSQVQRDFKITPTFGAITKKSVDDLMAGVQASLNERVKSSTKGSAGAIKIPIQFAKDNRQLKQELDALLKFDVEPIVVPVHFRRDADPTNPPNTRGPSGDWTPPGEGGSSRGGGTGGSGGTSGGGRTGGRRGRTRTAQQSNPQQPAATSTATQAPPRSTTSNADELTTMSSQVDALRKQLADLERQRAQMQPTQAAAPAPVRASKPTTGQQALGGVLTPEESSGLISAASKSAKRGRGGVSPGDLVKYIKANPTDPVVKKLQAAIAPTEGGPRPRRQASEDEVGRSIAFMIAASSIGEEGDKGKRSLEMVEKLYPGVGEALAAGSPAEARTAYIKSQYRPGKQQQGASKRIGLLGDDKRDPSLSYEGRPEDFAVQAFTRAMYGRMTPSKAGGPTHEAGGRGGGGGAQSASQRRHDAQVDAGSRDAREARQLLLDVKRGSIPKTQEVTEKDITDAERDVSRAESAALKAARLANAEVHERPSTPPAPKTFAILAEEEEARAAQKKHRAYLEKTLTGRGRVRDRNPLDYSPEDLHEFMTARPFHERPVRLGQDPAKRHPMSGSLFDLLTEGKAMGGYGPGGLLKIKSSEELDRFIDEQRKTGEPGGDLYSRWTYDLESERHAGFASRHQVDDDVTEKGMSVNRVGGPAEDGPQALYPWENHPYYEDGRPISNTYDGHKRSLYLMRGKRVGSGSDGEPVLDPESITPLALVSRLAQRGMKKRSFAMGGAASLSDLPGVAANATSITEVGEQGREAIVGLRGGGSFVVPNHQLSSFKKMAGMAMGGPKAGDDFEPFTGSVAGIPHDFVRPKRRSSMPLSDSKVFTQVNYDRSDRYQEGRDPKIHVAATRDEALATLNIVNDLAKEMAVTFKYVPRLDQMAVKSHGAEVDQENQGNFGPGGHQQGKFITAYPPAAQAKEFAERLRISLVDAGIGKGAAVAPSEIRYADDAPITHRSSAGDRYGDAGGYGPMNPDPIGTYEKPKRRRRTKSKKAYFDPMTGEYRDARGREGFDPGWSQDPYEGGGGEEPIDDGNYPGGGDAGWRHDPWEGGRERPEDFGWQWDPYEGGGGEGPPDDGNYPGGQPYSPRPRRRRATDWRVGGAPRGRFTFKGRNGQEITESQQGGTIAGHGEVQRVYVVNFNEMRGGAAGGTPLGRATDTTSTGPRRARAASGASPLEEEPPVAADPNRRELPTKGDLKFNRRSEAGSLARLGGFAAVADLTERLDTVGTDISEALQKSPVRALSVAIGQIAQTAIGGRADILRRAGEARHLRQRANVATGELAAAGEQVMQAELQLDPRNLESLFGIRSESEIATIGDEELQKKASEFFGTWNEQLKTGQEREKAIRPIAEEEVATAEKAAKTILTPGQQFKAQAVGLGGIVGGTLLFTAAMQAAQVAIAAFSEVTGEAVDRLSGFTMTMNQAADELAASIKQASGDIGAAVGTTAGTVGLPAGTDLSALAERSARLAGSQNLSAQTDLLRANRRAEQANGANAVQGLGTGFNNGPLSGIPLLGYLGWMGQTQGAAESLGGRFTGLGAYPQATEREVELSSVEGRDAAIDEMTEQILTSQKGNIADRTLARLAEEERPDADPVAIAAKWDKAAADARAAAEAAIAREAADVAGTGGVQGRARSLAMERIQWGKDVQSEVDTINASLEKMGIADFLEVIDKEAPGAKAKLDGFGKAMQDIGASGYTGSFTEKNVVATSSDGTPISADRMNRMLAAVLESALAPTVEDLAQASRRPYQAQLSAIQRNAEFQRESQIPADFFKQLAANPTLRMIGRPTTTGIIGPNAGGAERGAAGPYAGMIEGAYDQMAPYQQQGRQALLDLGVTEKEITAVENLGASIGRLNAKAQDLQLGMEQEQYNEQLFQTQRSLADINTILGKTGAQTSELGRLQRAQIQDQRQLTAIQLARSQRELNMQLALSQLRAPGETAEERAVRRREAEMIAREQQRELDIGKRSAGRGFRIEDIGYERQARDLATQLGLIQKARVVSVEVRGIGKAIEAKQALLGVKQAMIGVSQSVGTEVKKAGWSVIQAIESRLGTFNDTTFEKLSEYLAGWQEEWENFQKNIGATTPGGGGGGAGGGGGGGGRGNRPMASGGIFNPLGATSFVAGEAGNEQVVVLRNPRSGSMPAMTGRGGGGPVTIQLTLNAKVNNEGDENRLARKIAKMLHDEAAIVMGA